MFLPIATFISKKYTYEDYLKLEFELNSPEEVWEKAIDIFIDRINSRFFYAIDKLMENKDRYEMLKYGFAIMTLQCSLIDTFAKFRYGSNKQTERFYIFLKEYLIKNIDEEEKQKMASKFYKDIRCGLVHSGSTENMSGLSCDAVNLITTMKNGNKEFISVDIFIMDKELRKYFKEYINRLRNKDEELRKNFVKIMNHVCKV